MQSIIDAAVKAAGGNVELVIANVEDPNLVVSFGCFGVKPNRFFFYKTFAALEKNVLFINAPINNWYTEPLPWFSTNSIAKSFEGFANLVNAICRLYGFSRVRLFGFSMGGHGALLYSSAKNFSVPVDCIVVGTNTPLNLPKTISLRNYHLISEDYGVTDLSGIDFDMVGKNYAIVFGEFDVSDAYSGLVLRRLLGSKAEIGSHIGSTHNIPVHMTNTMGLAYGMEKLLNLDLDFPGRGKIADVLTEEDLEPLPYFSPTINQPEEIAYMHDLVRRYPQYAFGLNRIGAYLHNKGDLNGAFEYLQRSWEIAPNNENTNHHLSLVFEKRGQLDSAFAHALLAKKALSSPVNVNRYEAVKNKIVSSVTYV
ncbi:hypothetical protein E5C31_15700 [Providencia rettgeri]|nr:hypothetical protein [Providencia rettgeri]